jgi:hypothetical protein
MCHDVCEREKEREKKGYGEREGPKHTQSRGGKRNGVREIERERGKQ